MHTLIYRDKELFVGDVPLSDFLTPKECEQKNPSNTLWHRWEWTKDGVYVVPIDLTDEEEWRKSLMGNRNPVSPGICEAWKEVVDGVPVP